MIRISLMKRKKLSLVVKGYVLYEVERMGEWPVFILKPAPWSRRWWSSLLHKTAA